jgi:hypothetical protein
MRAELLYEAIGLDQDAAPQDFWAALSRMEIWSRKTPAKSA